MGGSGLDLSISQLVLSIPETKRMLVLYVRTGCPFCRRVLDYASHYGIALEEKNLSIDEQNLGELLEIGGRQQVPFLLDEWAGISLYESNEIVKYLRQKYV